MRLGGIFRTIVALAAVCLAVPASAQDYPSRPITVVVPFPPGGSTNLVMRIVADKLGELLGQQMVIDNRGGAGGTVGTRSVAKSAPDGYTIGLGYTGPLAIAPTLYDNLGFDPRKDFAPIGRIGTAPNSLVVHPSFPAKSIAELIAYGKANPGKINFGSAGVGTVSHLAGEYFATRAGIKLIHIPYKGTLPGLTDVASGNVSMEFSDLTPALPLIQAGKLKLIAVLAAKRDPDMPDVPALAETVPGYAGQSWQGFFARAGTPKPIVDALNAALVADLKKPETAARFNTMGIVAQSNTPEEFRAFIVAETEKWGKVIKAAGIEPQ